MAGMKKLAPRLQKIKETYEGDKQKIGKKTMELYKKEFQLKTEYLLAMALC